MIRFLIATTIALVASAIGLIAAALILGDDVEITGAAFFIAVAIFTVTTAIINPFVMKSTMKKAQALLGASALITTFIGLVVTHWLSKGLQISGGATTWLFATLIVWLASLLAAVIIPIVLVKKGVQNVRDNNN